MMTHIVRPKPKREARRSNDHFSYAHSFGASADPTGSPYPAPVTNLSSYALVFRTLSDIATNTQMIFSIPDFRILTWHLLPT
jgi:hypothetical protein